MKKNSKKQELEGDLVNAGIWKPWGLLGQSKEGAGIPRRSLFTWYFKKGFYCQNVFAGQRHFSWELRSTHLCLEISSFIPSVLQQSSFQNLKLCFFMLCLYFICNFHVVDGSADQLAWWLLIIALKKLLQAKGTRSYQLQIEKGKWTLSEITHGPRLSPLSQYASYN